MSHELSEEKWYVIDILEDVYTDARYFLRTYGEREYVEVKNFVEGGLQVYRYIDYLKKTKKDLEENLDNYLSALKNSQRIIAVKSICSAPILEGRT